VRSWSISTRAKERLASLWWYVTLVAALGLTVSVGASVFLYLVLISLAGHSLTFFGT
jgi:hypothetical protein